MSIKILSLTNLPNNFQGEIEKIDSRLQLTMAPGWFDGEIRDTWPSFTTDRYLAPDSNGKATREERDKLLNDAEILLVGFPFPLDLKARSPKLNWVHQRPAGASNMLRGDLWQSDIVVTSSRGYAHNLPIAEYTLATMLHFAKNLHLPEKERKNKQLNAREYNVTQLKGKTLCVLGAGGIGTEVARITSALGMRVLGIRRNASENIEGFESIYGRDQLYSILSQSDYLAICCQWTPETENLINDDAFEAIKENAVIVNIARGEIIDEPALIRALTRNKIKGAALDVYVGEFERPPDSRLWNDYRVLITPHISAASDINTHRGNELFLKNLKRYLANEPLENIIDWDKGY